MTLLVQVGKVREMRILQRGRGFVVELGRVRPQLKQHDRELVEFHPSPLGTRSGRSRPLRVRVSHASGSPVSSSVLSPLSTLIQPTPATLAAVFGAPSSSSWTTVSSETPPSCGSISHVTRLSSSVASSGLYSERQPCTSRRGGSNSATSASPQTSPFGPCE